MLVQSLWVLLIFEVDQYAAAVTGVPFNRLPTLVAPLLMAITVMASKRRTVYWPLVLFVMMHIGASLFAENAGLSRVPTKYLIYIALLWISTASFVDSPAKVNTILKLLIVSFAWFALQGIPYGGKVLWHSLLANEDSFGPLMCIGSSLAYFYSISTRDTRWRWIARAIFAICLLGLVVSFARGAALAGAAVLLYVLLLSPNRVRTFVSLLVTTIILVPLVMYFVPLDAYLAEIGSSAEGDPVRTHLWGLAYRVFKTSPLIGVGVENFGVIADQIATPEDHDMVWGSIYFRAVHNTAVQIMAEEGIIGLLLWGTMILGFFRWNMRLRSKAAIANWRAQEDGTLDLKSISRGLDGAMLGFLITSVFYNQLYIHWFWSLMILSFVLHRMVIVIPASRARANRRRRPANAPAFPERA